uniref:dTDP-4-dehydrorhamnose reductase n=1 Tax=Cyanothece sp. (strain PCC 7425 / ATCC 29141) TaxID=395961 RepID=B8HYA7_CYAP4
MKKKLLVTGASGFLGWNLCQMAQADWQVYGTGFAKNIQIPGVHFRHIDLRNFVELKQFLLDIQPDGVIHTAAQSNPNYCQLNPQESYEINVRTSGDLASLCAEMDIPLVFTSTDLVFDGQHSPYRETDPVCPLSVYGEHKVAAERLIQNAHPGAVLARMPLMFGVAASAQSFIQPFVKILRSGQELKLFVDEFRTPVSAETAARGLLLILQKQFKGILHLGGQERLSRYQFGQQMVEVLQLDPTLLKPCHQADVPMAAPRPRDVCLDSSLAYSLGYVTRSIREELERLHDHL